MANYRVSKYNYKEELQKRCEEVFKPAKSKRYYALVVTPADKVLIDTVDLANNTNYTFEPSLPACSKELSYLLGDCDSLE